MTGVVEFKNISKSFGNVTALSRISAVVPEGKVSCVLGDNGAGKSTLIGILAGVHRPDEGQVLLDGANCHLGGPQDALRRGIATVFQDLGMIPSLAIWRNFVLGAEPLLRIPLVRVIDQPRAKELCTEAVARLGIRLGDLGLPVSALSGGQRQAVAIARAIHLGARVLVLDEPTAALGVRQVGMVLRNIVKVRQLGVTVLLVTHNPAHALLVGDHFILLRRGRECREVERADISPDELAREMGGTGREFEEIEAELRGEAGGI